VRDHRGREVERAHREVAERADLVLGAGRDPDRARRRDDPQHAAARTRISPAAA
jgi:hypothetical protein